MTILIQSNSITVKDGKILMNNSDGRTYTPGGIVLEGQNPEEVCKASGNVKIIKPLHPMLRWKDIGFEKVPIISLNYLTEEGNV